MSLGKEKLVINIPKVSSSNDKVLNPHKISSCRLSSKDLEPILIGNPIIPLDFGASPNTYLLTIPFSNNRNSMIYSPPSVARSITNRNLGNIMIS
jgi:hypothetical protein